MRELGAPSLAKREDICAAQSADHKCRLSQHRVLQRTAFAEVAFALEHPPFVSESGGKARAEARSMQVKTCCQALRSRDHPIETGSTCRDPYCCLGCVKRVKVLWGSYIQEWTSKGKRSNLPVLHAPTVSVPALRFSPTQSCTALVYRTYTCNPQP